MRDFKGMKRQRGRNRGGGGGKPQHNANRSFESNGPDVKVRGNAQTVFEKYQQLARDAGSAGDRVLAENYLQHAEHYFRLLRAMQPQRAPSDIIGRDQLSSGLDIDFEAEPEEQSSNDQNNDQDGDDNASDNQHGERRDNRQRDDRQRDDRQRDDRQQGEGGNNRGRRDRWRDRDDRQGRFENRQQGDQARDPMAVVEPQAQPLPSEQPAEASPVLRSASGDVSHAPAFLGAPRTEPSEEAPAPKPRRGRKPKAAAPAEEEA